MVRLCADTPMKLTVRCTKQLWKNLPIWYIIATARTIGWCSAFIPAVLEYIGNDSFQWYWMKFKKSVILKLTWGGYTWMMFMFFFFKSYLLIQEITARFRNQMEHDISFPMISIIKEAPQAISQNVKVKKNIKKWGIPEFLKRKR